MKKIITISREYGSGGHTIGQIIAKELGIPFYDKEIIDNAAENSGLSADFIKNNEQSISSGWLYSLIVGSAFSSGGTINSPANNGAVVLPLADQVFNAQRQAILELAKSGPCVIVGRCADYILKHSEEINQDDVLNLFIYAPLEDKVKRAIEQKGLDPATAEKTVKTIDKRRGNHYNTFTGRTWGNRSHYDMMINSSMLGVEQTGLMLAEFVKRIPD